MACVVLAVAGLGLTEVRHALLPELHVPLPSTCDGDVAGDDVMRCWGMQMAKAMPAQFMCNVSKLPSGVHRSWLHPALNHNNLKDFLLPPHTHLFLYGESHIRSVRHVLLSAAKLFNRPVESRYLSISDDCDEQPEGFTGEALKKEHASASICGLFSEDHKCKSGDLLRDIFVSELGNSSITMVANHMQYLLPSSPLDPPEPKHTIAVNKLLASYPYTHGHFQFPHFRKYFDAHCQYRKGGPKPDPKNIGDGAERSCDIAKPACIGTSPLYQVLKRHIPRMSFLGGVGLRHGLGTSTSCSRVHDTYAQDILENSQSKFDSNGNLIHVHACNVICSHAHEQPVGLSPYEGALCTPAEGVVVAWEVLRSAGLLACPPEWKSCDSIDLQPLWVLDAKDGTNEPRASCPSGERNAAKDECYAATAEAVGEAQVTGPLLEVNVDPSRYPSGCSYGRAEKRPIFNDNPGSTTTSTQQLAGAIQMNSKELSPEQSKAAAACRSDNVCRCKIYGDVCSGDRTTAPTDRYPLHSPDHYCAVYGLCGANLPKHLLSEDGIPVTPIPQGYPHVCTLTGGDTTNETPILAQNWPVMRTVPSDAQAAETAADIAEEIAYGWRRRLPSMLSRTTWA